MAQIIDGKAIALSLRENIGKEVQALTDSGKRPPGLAVILVGEDPASQVYVRNKEKACAKAGIYSQVLRIPAESREEELLALVHQFNENEKIDGILVQLPLPGHINESKIINSILPEKDVDGFHPVNVGKLVLGEDCLTPCTPTGVMKMLEACGLSMNGKEVVVVGRSNIVGKPMALMALQKEKLANGTVTICHSGTEDLPSKVRRADVIIAAIGRAKMITGEMIKPGAVVIDVGMNRLENGTLCGDVDFDAAMEVASWVTPVPGGVGRMTIAMLMHNTLQAYRQREE